MKSSIIVTVRNEEARIEALLASLVEQHPHEVILVDAMSSDRTVERARRYGDRLPLTIERRPCTRGEGRNIGAQRATGDLLLFIDGDCVAAPDWLRRMEQAWGSAARRIVAGTTRQLGRPSFTRLHRVELPHRGQDTTWPSCNLGYPRMLFAELGGFDPAFVTAEDIDLNYRAVTQGAVIAYVPDAIVHAHARDSIKAFLKQAYWNGYGRKQLTLKHGRLWAQYSFWDLVRTQASPTAWLRLAAGACGYLVAKVRQRR